MAKAKSILFNDFMNMLAQEGAKIRYGGPVTAFDGEVVKKDPNRIGYQYMTPSGRGIYSIEVYMDEKQMQMESRSVWHPVAMTESQFDMIFDSFFKDAPDTW